MTITARTLGRDMRAMSALFLAPALWWAAPAAADTLHATDDTTVLVGVPATQGALPTLNVGNTGVARHGFARFDLSTLPSTVTGADIDSATLRIYPVVVRRPGTLEVHRVDGPWSEGTLTGAGAPPLDPLAVDAVPVAATDAGSFLTADVTDLVRDWVDGIVPNDGLALTSTVGADVVLESKESRLAGNAPEIEVALAIVVDTDTSAATECGPGQVLLGNGSCLNTASITPDTNAATLCLTGEILAGDGSCVPIPDDRRAEVNFTLFNQFTCEGDNDCFRTLTCPEGFQVINGGYRPDPDSDPNFGRCELVASFPTGRRTWRYRVKNTNLISDCTGRSYLFCIPD